MRKNELGSEGMGKGRKQNILGYGSDKKKIKKKGFSWSLLHWYKSLISFSSFSSSSSLFYFIFFYSFYYSLFGLFIHSLVRSV